MRSPIIITSRLLPGVRIGGAEISIEATGLRESNGKPVWGYHIDLPNGTQVNGEDLAGWGNATEMLATLAAFLSACGEAVSYSRATGREAENVDLFPPSVAAWADENSDELSMLTLELEEAQDAHES